MDFVFINRSFSSTIQRVVDPDPLLMRKIRWTCLEKVQTVLTGLLRYLGSSSPPPQKKGMIIEDGAVDTS